MPLRGALRAAVSLSILVHACETVAPMAMASPSPRLIASCPRPLILSAENGLLSLRKQFPNLPAWPIYETHSLVTNGWLLAYDGVITAGHTAPLEGFFSPHTGRLLAALSKAGKGVSVVMNDQGLHVAGKSLRVRVPVVPGGQVNVPYPTQPMYACDDRVALAIEAVLPLTKAGAETVLESSIKLTTYGTAIVTNRQVCLEAYHGIICTASGPRFDPPSEAMTTWARGG